MRTFTSIRPANDKVILVLISNWELSLLNYTRWLMQARRKRWAESHCWRQRQVLATKICGANDSKKNIKRWLRYLVVGLVEIPNDDSKFNFIFQYVQNNKKTGTDWFRLESNKEGTKWFGKCWCMHNLLKYEFNVEFEVSKISLSTKMSSVIIRNDSSRFQ